MNEHERMQQSFTNELLGLTRAPFMNEHVYRFVHVEFVHERILIIFVLSNERTKTFAFTRFSFVLVHLWTNECSFVLAVQRLVVISRNGHPFGVKLVLTFLYWTSTRNVCPSPNMSDKFKLKSFSEKHFRDQTLLKGCYKSVSHMYDGFHIRP